MPNYPLKLVGATGQFMNGMVIVCGGYYSVTNECHKLSKGESAFKFLTSMQEKRSEASSTIINENLWVTGGQNENGINLKTTEFVISQSADTKSILTQNIILPEPVRMHVILNLNYTTSILIRGYRNGDWTSDKTHYYNHVNKEWITGPKLMNGRSQHTAGIIKDQGTYEEHIVVVGGYDGNGSTDSVEIIFNGKHVWTKGISLNWNHFDLLNCL